MRGLSGNKGSDFVPDDANTGVLHVWVADHLGYLLPILLATLYRSGVVAAATALLCRAGNDCAVSNRCLMLDGVLKEVDVHRVKCN